jgi:hypothetical protein
MLRKRRSGGLQSRSARDCDLRFAPCLPAPERLVGLGFRYWMLGRKTGDISSWERAWDLYSGVFGLCGARLAVGSLSCWVGAVNRWAQREIQVFPEGCGSFCRDECIAVSMIAACQHNTCPAMRSCAFALMESSTLDRVTLEAQVFADVLTGLEMHLSPGSIVTPPINTERQRLPH